MNNEQIQQLNNMCIAARDAQLGSIIQELSQGGAGGKIEIVDNLDSTDIDKALSANQGKVLNDTITELHNEVNTQAGEIEKKQNILIFDDVPKAESNNPVKSEGIKSAIDEVKTELTGEINKKANKATNLGGYGITDAYTKAEIDSKIAGAYRYIGTKTVVEVSAIDTKTLSAGDVYNISDNGILSGDVKVNKGDNVAWTGTGWDNLAGLVDLSNYQEKLFFDDTPTADSDNPVKSSGIYTELNNKVSKVSGKILSTNDYTNEDKAEVGNIKNKQDKLTYDEKPTADSANSLTSGAIKIALDAKVDKVNGKVLSDNNYTTAEKTKLSGIAEGANNYVLPEDVVKNTDYATIQKAGVVKIGGGLTNGENGVLSINPATPASIYGRTDSNTPIVPSNLNEAVKAALSDSSRISDMTDTEKENARGVIGAAAQADLANKQDKLTFDSIPTANSDNPVKSSAIKTALDNLATEVNKKQTPQTTLSGYGITDAYAKGEIDTKLSVIGDTSTLLTEDKTTLVAIIQDLINRVTALEAK